MNSPTSPAPPASLGPTAGAACPVLCVSDTHWAAPMGTAGPIHCVVYSECEPLGAGTVASLSLGCMEPPPSSHWGRAGHVENRNFWPQTEHFWLKTTKFHVAKLPPSPGGAGVRVPRALTRCRPGSLSASWESLLVGAVRSGSQDSWVLFPALPLARCEALSDSRPHSVPQFLPLENREKTLLPGLGGIVRVPVTGPCPTGVCVCVCLSLSV